MSVNSTLLSAADERAMGSIVSMLDNLRVGELKVVLPDGRWRLFGHEDAELRSTLEVHDCRSSAS